MQNFVDWNLWLYMKYRLSNLLYYKCSEVNDGQKLYWEFAPFEMDTYFVSLAYIEDAVDDGIHAGVGAREEEKCSLNAWVDFKGRRSIDPVPVCTPIKIRKSVANFSISRCCLSQKQNSRICDRERRSCGSQSVYHQYIFTSVGSAILLTFGMRPRYY